MLVKIRTNINKHQSNLQEKQQTKKINFTVKKKILRQKKILAQKKKNKQEMKSSAFDPCPYILRGREEQGAPDAIWRYTIILLVHVKIR